MFHQDTDTGRYITLIVGWGYYKFSANSKGDQECHTLYMDADVHY